MFTCCKKEWFTYDFKHKCLYVVKKNDLHMILNTNVNMGKVAHGNRSLIEQEL